MDDDIRNRYRRDYTNELIPRARPQHQPNPRPERHPSQQHHQPPAPAATHTPQAHHPVGAYRKPKKRRRRLWLSLLLIVLIAIAAGSGYWYKSNRLSSPIPANIRASVNYPILYPGQLPSGYHLDNNSYTSSGGVVLYSAVNSSGTKIAFTDQQRPSGFDFNKFYTQGLSSSTSFDTVLGQAALGTANGKLLGSIATDQSWLLVSSTSKSVTSADLKLILSNAKQAPSAK